MEAAEKDKEKQIKKANKEKEKALKQSKGTDTPENESE